MSGPALIGAWRSSRIVLPADFEPSLRRDRAGVHSSPTKRCMRAGVMVGWCLLAQLDRGDVLVPSAGVVGALGALRHDQELACDAAVLREHGAQRRNYANAMLKTQSAAFALPVGCPWSPRHPLTERIAMLKLTPPGRLRRRVGRITVASFSRLHRGRLDLRGQCTLRTSVRRSRFEGLLPSDEYQLDMMVELGTGDAHSQSCRSDDDWRSAWPPGKSAHARTTHGWTIEATPVPDGEQARGCASIWQWRA